MSSPHSPVVRPRRSLPRWAAVAAALALGLSGCSLTGPAAPSGSESASSEAAVPEGLQDFYGQDVSWSKCHGTFECATIQAPLDYAHPEGKKIKLALMKAPATKRDGQGKPLFINPGGPGASGVQFLQEAYGTQFDSRLKAAYDLVGFDPRGVGRSTAVKCLTDKQRDEQREDATLPTDDAQMEQAFKDEKDLAAECEKKTPEGLLQHISTLDAVKDLDLMRAVLGAPKLDYFGMSYGTKLGAYYQELFPKNTGRMVLDGAMDPSLDAVAVGEGQAKAFERAVDVYLNACLQEPHCPFTGSEQDARKQLKDFIAKVEKHPMKAADGRKLSGMDLMSAIMLPLYAPEAYGTLNDALALGMTGDPSALLHLADFSADRQDNGTYSSNTDEAFAAINCLDYGRGTDSLSEMKKRAASMVKTAPLIGPYMAYDTQCAGWPAKQVLKPGKLDVADDVNGALIIGTTGDPATPYPWAKALQEQLPHSVLLTYRGEGHTAYGRSNECVTNTVDEYLIDGKLPASGKQC